MEGADGRVASPTLQSTLQPTDDVEVCGYSTKPLDTRAFGISTRPECDHYDARFLETDSQARGEEWHEHGDPANETSPMCLTKCPHEINEHNELL